MAELTDKQWATELDRIIRGPVWPLLRGWWVRVLVQRVLVAEDPLMAAADAAGDLRGAMALMLALENELADKAEVIDGRRYRGQGHARTEERKPSNINGTG